MYDLPEFDSTIKLRNPKEIEPLHDINHPEKVVKMVNHLIHGGELPPVIVWGKFALSGTHRLAAHIETDKMVSVIELPDEYVHQFMDAWEVDFEELFYDANQTLYDMNLYYVSHPEKGE